MSCEYIECEKCGKVVDVQILDNHGCNDAYGECRGGAQQITVEVLQQQARLAALREAREKIDSLTLDKEYAGHYHQGFGMAVSQSLVAIDDMIDAVLQPNAMFRRPLPRTDD